MWLVKIKVYLNEVSVTLGDVVMIAMMIMSFGLPDTKDSPVFGIPIFWLWMYPMQVIPETRRAD